MNNNDPNNESLFYSLVDIAEGSVREIVEFVGDEFKSGANAATAPAQQAAQPEMSEAEYFAHAVGDTEKYPPKNEEMGDLVKERQASEEIDAALRQANGGSADLTEPQRDQQMQDRMEAYQSAQNQLKM